MLAMRNLCLAFVILLYILVGSERQGFSQEENSPQEESRRTKVKEEEMFLFFDFLEALNFYSKSADALFSMPNSKNFRVEMMVKLLDSNRYIKNGNDILHSSIHKLEENKMPSIHTLIALDTFQNLISYFEQILDSNTQLLQFMRSESNQKNNSSERDYAFAQHITALKENSNKAVESAVKMKYFLHSWRYEEDEEGNPKGKIPFSITLTQRKEVLDEIETLFGNNIDREIKDRYCRFGEGSSRFDSESLLIVKIFQITLEADTFEQVKVRLPKPENCK